jgi:hypothetical protein
MKHLCTKAVKSSHGVEPTFIDNKMTFESIIEQIMSLERISIPTTYHSHYSSHARNLGLHLETSYQEDFAVVLQE